MKITIKTGIVTGILLFVLNIGVNACTTAVISGKASPDGRPLLWKHRDTWAVNNKIVQFFDGKYACIGLVNSSDQNGNSIWIGFNEKGFGIMNSASYNLNSDTLKQSGLEGRLMKRALQTCATVADFEKFLDELERPILLEANFGVIDAENAAAYFELGNFSYTKYDANDPSVAPHGYLIRTNHSFSGEPGVGGGYIRYVTAARVFEDASETNTLSYKTIIQKASRNLSHSLTNTDLNHYEVYQKNTETMVLFKDYIPRSGSSSSCIVQGVKPGENSELTLMWSVVGFPLTSVVTPVWINEKVELPEVLKYNSSIEDSPICDFALTLKDSVYAFKKGSHADYYIDINKIINADGTGYIQTLEPLENSIIDEAELTLNRWRENGEIDKKNLKEFYKWMDRSIYEFYNSNFNLSLNNATK